MNETAKLGLTRLREGDALERLAAMVVDQTTATPITEIASPRWIASQLATALEGATGEAARSWAAGRLDREQGRWSDVDTPLREKIPDEVEEPLRKLLAREWSPDEDLTFRILDQAAIRDVLRMVLTNGIVRFRKRISDVDSKLGGLGKRAARRGKGLLGGLQETVRSSNLGGMAQDLVGTLKDEVEGSLDGKIGEFARGAAQDQVRAIARYLADPEHADAFATLRVSILDVVLDTPISELASEVDRMGPDEAMDVVFAAIGSAVAADDFVERTEQRIQALFEEAGDGTLGDWLTEIELLDVWRETTTELVAARLRAVVDTTEFEAWWGGLFA